MDIKYNADFFYRTIKSSRRYTLLLAGHSLLSNLNAQVKNMGDMKRHNSAVNVVKHFTWWTTMAKAEIIKKYVIGWWLLIS